MEKELGQNNKTLNNAGKEFDDAEKQANKFGDGVKRSADKADDTRGRFFQKLGGVLKGVGAAMGAAIAAVGAAAASAAKSLTDMTVGAAAYADEILTIATVTGSIKGDNITEQLDMIKAWLYQAGGSDLIFSFQTDKKYIVQVVNSIDFNQVFRIISRFIIVFSCRPFKYAVDNEPIIISSSGAIILNPGSAASRPVIKVYRSGDLDISINSTHMLYYMIRYV